MSVGNTGLFLRIVGGTQEWNEIAEQINTDRNEDFPNHHARGTNKETVEHGCHKPKEEYARKGVFVDLLLFLDGVFRVDIFNDRDRDREGHGRSDDEGERDKRAFCKPVVERGQNIGKRATARKGEQTNED